MHWLPLMARYNRWADTRLDACAPGLDEEAYRRDRAAFFGSVRRTLTHLLLVDRLWSARIQHREFGIGSLNPILFEGFEGLKDARVEEDEKLIAVVDRLCEADLEAPVRHRRITCDRLEEAGAGHILVTLFNHQTHDRGQVHVMLTQARVSPPPLDIIDCLEEVGEAAPRGTIVA